MHVESNKTKTFRPLLLCMINTPHGLSEYTNIWVHPIKTFLWQHILRIPFFYIRPKNRLHFYTPCQVLVINLDKTSSMAKFSWSFVRWAMLQTVNWVILPNGMMQNTQVCHITCSAILPALTLNLIFNGKSVVICFRAPPYKPPPFFASAPPPLQVFVNGPLSPWIMMTLSRWKAAILGLGQPPEPPCLGWVRGYTQ